MGMYVELFGWKPSWTVQTTGLDAQVSCEN